MKLLQFSDLHLSAVNEPAYCLRVLREIVTKASELQCDAMLLCGDIFDTYGDLVTLRTQFIEILSSYRGPVYFLPGNHESLRRQIADTSFQIYDWGDQVIFMETLPFEFKIISDEVELLAIPHSTSYGDLVASLPPQKSSRVRIGLAHATVMGMSFAGLDSEIEEGAGLLDISQLQAMGCDYVAVGHIHSARSTRFGNMDVVYAGSSRVWRKGEMGPRGGILIEVKDGMIQKTNVRWENAGIYSEVAIQLGLDGMPEKSAEEYLSSFSEHDWVRIRWSGIVETMAGKIEFQNILKTEWSSKVRNLDFDTDESDLKVEANLQENSYIQKFIQLMETKRSGMESSAWMRAKKLGLELLLEGKK
jgi:DNA repair exonuclease SbcCD nuclease subunit